MQNGIRLINSIRCVWFYFFWSVYSMFFFSLSFLISSRFCCWRCLALYSLFSSIPIVDMLYECIMYAMHHGSCTLFSLFQSFDRFLLKIFSSFLFDFSFVFFLNLKFEYFFFLNAKRQRRTLFLHAGESDVICLSYFCVVLPKWNSINFHIKWVCAHFDVFFFSFLLLCTTASLSPCSL